MVSSAMISKLNEQINVEIYSAHMYLQMGAWCSYKSLEGCASFLISHADEEIKHMKRLLNYVREVDGLAKISEMKSPATDFDSVVTVFEKIYAHEKFVTSKINELVHLADTEPDYSTLQFLQWYVAEQHEEESLFKGILDKINLIGTQGQGLFFIDREVGSLLNKTDDLEASEEEASTIVE